MPLWRRTRAAISAIGLDCADLVVGEHDADQDRLGRDGRLDVVRIDAAVAIHRQLHDLETELLEIADGVADGVVLDRTGDDPVAASLAGPGRALEGEVVGLGAAGGEDDLARSGAKGSGHALVGLVQPRAGTPAEAVQRGGVAEIVRQERQHGLEGFTPQRSGGGVVEVDGHRSDCTPRAGDYPIQATGRV